MENLKTNRNGHRSSITRLINRTNEKISDKEIGNQELSAAVETLMIKKDILENLDKQILDGTEVEDVEQEMRDNDEYNSHLEVALRKFKDDISKSGANVLKPTLSASPANIPGSNSGTENTNQIQPTGTLTKVRVRVKAGERKTSMVNVEEPGTARFAELSASLANIPGSNSGTENTNQIQTTGTSTKFTKEVINFTKMGMIILNILFGVLYDLLKPDKPHLRPRSDCDITYLYAEHRKLNKHTPSNGWGGSWQKIQNTNIAIGDDIERIRLIRNELQNSPSFKLGDLRFNELVSITNDILRRLNYHSKPTRLYTDELKEILAGKISAEETAKAINQKMDVFVDVVPTEIKSMTDKQSVPLYLHLLESGSEKKRDIRLVVVGKKEAGKTSLLRRLFSEGIEDVHSTNGIEIHTITCKTKSDDGIWNKSDGSNEESKIQAGLLKQYREIIKAPITTDLNGRMDESTEPETSSQQPEIRKHHVTAELQVNTSESTQRPDRFFEQTKKDLEKMLKSDVNSHDKEEYATLLFWDFAGDEEFYHTHQTFLSPDAIYLVVANLSEADNKEAQDLFCLWMDSIHCYCKMESDDIIRTQEYLDPPVVVVGTWKDAMTSQSGEILEVCKKSILTYTENITEDERRHIRDDVVISNTEDDSSVFQSIRQEILKIARTLRTWNKDYPLKFIQLEKSLHEKKKVKPIIAFDELKQISTETPKPLNDEELILYLKYHHDIRALVYFEDLPDYIILDTLWLSNAFKCIVSAKKFRNVSIKNQKRWEEFHCRGKLHREVLEDIFQKEHKSLYKHKDHILNVMEKFDILIHPNISETHLPDLQTCYYVPCMIKEEPESDIYEMFNVTTKNCQKSIWLCFKFSFLPPHLKNHLTASLCRKYDIAEVGVLKQKKKQIALFRSTVVFELQKNKMRKLLVMTCQNIIQIQVLEFGKEVKAGLYSYVADYVTDEINKIISLRFKMSNVIIEKKLECGLTEPESVTGSNYFSEEKFAEYYCDTCKAAHRFNDEWLEVQNTELCLSEATKDDSDSNSSKDGNNENSITKVRVRVKTDLRVSSNASGSSRTGSLKGKQLWKSN
ncbi:probable serine/threonine-protein kinase roco8 isoform X2 [Mytilus edulis]|uniref:probable serine/threonine-protein kinase roco8 isoform X2 n=1 Tax=Mytilus edulis TaxID=6550 RepID=UPI0039EF0F6C